MKRIISLFLAAFLMLALVPAQNVFAANGVKLQAIPNYKTAKPGDTVTVSIKISGVKSAGNIICAAPVILKYDSAKFTFVSAAPGSAITKTDFLAHNQGSQVYLDYSDSTGGKKPLKTDGTLFLVKLKVKSGVTSGSSPLTLTAAKGTVANAKMAAVSVAVTNATVKFAKSISPASIKVSSAKLTLGVKEAKQLTVTPSPANASKSVTWSSSNKTVATVSSGGKVTAVKAGTVKITAKTSNNKTVTCTVTVKAAPSSVKLSRKSVTIGVGESYKPSVTLSPAKAAGGYSFSVKNKAIAIVSSTGTIKGVKAGTTTVTVKTYNSKTYTITVTVKAAPKSVKLDKSSLTLTKGKTYTLKTTLNPTASASYLRTFTSSNKAVATVSGAGKITALKAGTATITVKTYNGKIYKCKVTVK